MKEIVNDLGEGLFETLIPVKTISDKIQGKIHVFHSTIWSEVDDYKLLSVVLRMIDTCGGESEMNVEYEKVDVLIQALTKARR